MLRFASITIEKLDQFASSTDKGPQDSCGFFILCRVGRLVSIFYQEVL